MVSLLIAEKVAGVAVQNLEVLDNPNCLNPEWDPDSLLVPVRFLRMTTRESSETERNMTLKPIYRTAHTSLQTGMFETECLFTPTGQ